MRYERPRRSATPSVLPDLPASFERVRHAYLGFTPRYEFNRASFSQWLAPAVNNHSLSDIEGALNIVQVCPWRPIPALLQRHFYWGATCFVRGYNLLLAYLTLERRGLRSWADVTGYYSRFYAAKAILNLCLMSWVHLDRLDADRKASPDYLIYLGTPGVRFIAAKATGVLWEGGTHSRWWNLFDQLRRVTDFPPSVSIPIALMDFDSFRGDRNAINYSDRWMEGFPELEWFDSDVGQMLAHADRFRGRGDEDFTDIDRYFEGQDPEGVDVADFYTDPVQILWHSLLMYLDLLDVLQIGQSLVTYEKLIVLTEHILADDYPRARAGICHTLASREARIRSA